ncbi:MAG: LysM domain-containing protein [Polyangia bacterium]|jgi:hypothetical protein
MLEPGSRYDSVEVAQMQQNGQTIRYLRRRFVPQIATQTTLTEHIVTETDRLDQIAALSYGDPLQAYRLLDANAVLHPRELLTVRRRIRIALSGL